MWHNIKKLVAHWQKLPKYKRQSSKSYANVKAAVEDSMTPAKFTFFSFVAGILQPILVKYQSEKPMVPCMYQDLLKFLRKLVQLIVKPDIVANCSSVIDLECLDLDDKNLIMKPKDMNIGFGTRNIITDLKRKDAIRNTQTANFFTDVTKFIISMVKKLFDKNPLECKVVRNSVIFDPQFLVNENASVFQNKLKRLHTHLMKRKIVTSVQCYKITEQFTDFTDSQLKLYAEKFCGFDSSTKYLDEF